MQKQKIFLYILLGFLLCSPSSALAEPWLATRYAQNCASCHAPGRINRTPEKRRCTLSCQGCHVNPNGGGLRNFYGKWNSDRFLKSYNSKLTWGKKLPAPFKKQRYAKKKVKKKTMKKWARRGPKIINRNGNEYKDKDYVDKINYKRTARNLYQDLMYITSNDPYRKERTTDIYVTGDARVFLMNLNRGDGGEFLFWPMSFDIGARIRPTKNHRLSFVYETRAFNSFGDRSLDTFIAPPPGAIFTRSAYLLYDDLPYNSYLQAGFFRPLFGLYNPNHFTLFADYTGLNQNSVFKAFGAGMAPNVPFFIFNWLTEGNSENKFNDFAEEEGFVITAGLRGVTLGWSLIGSYWSTVNRRINNRKLMFDINAAAQIGRFTLTGDFVRIDKTDRAGNNDATSLLTVETKFRAWRETYLQLNYSQANAAQAGGDNLLQPGSGSELAFGVKAFLVAGVEMELLFQRKTNKPEQGEENVSTAIQTQLHVFF